MEENINLILEQLQTLNKQIKILEHNIDIIKEQTNQISTIQAIHNDSLIFLINKVSDYSNSRLLNQLLTIDAKLNDNDLKISSLDDMIEEVKSKLDLMPDQFQLILDSLSAIYHDKSNKNSNPYGGLIIS